MLWFWYSILLILRGPSARHSSASQYEYHWKCQLCINFQVTSKNLLDLQRQIDEHNRRTYGHWRI